MVKGIEFAGTRYVGAGWSSAERVGRGIFRSWVGGCGCGFKGYVV